MLWVEGVQEWMCIKDDDDYLLGALRRWMSSCLRQCPRRYWLELVQRWYQVENEGKIRNIRRWRDMQTWVTRRGRPILACHSSRDCSIRDTEGPRPHSGPLPIVICSEHRQKLLEMSDSVKLDASTESQLKMTHISSFAITNRKASPWFQNWLINPGADENNSHDDKKYYNNGWSKFWVTVIVSSPTCQEITTIEWTFGNFHEFSRFCEKTFDEIIHWIKTNRMI